MSKRPKPAKPRPDFPLTANSNGQWMKKIKGRQYCFGPWDDPDAALRRYVAELPSILSGERVVHTSEGEPAHGDYTVEDACNHSLAAKKRRLTQGKITQRWYDEHEDLAKRIARVLGRKRPLGTLRPKDFEVLLDDFASTLGPHAITKAVTGTRSIFNYAAESELVDGPVRFGSAFKPPSKAEKRRHRQKKGRRFFEPTSVRALLKAAESEQASDCLRAMILLAANCGFNNTDCGQLSENHLDLGGEVAWVEMPRSKTGVSRRAALWPETAEALKDAMRDNDPRKGFERLALLTRHRKGWTPLAISHAFRRLAKRAGVYQEGLTFSALRHTFRTVADEVKDPPAVRTVMGHVDDSIDDVYREFVEDWRLRDVADHVRRWLYAAEAEAA